jgi:two-component system OmpR family response regulator
LVVDDDVDLVESLVGVINRSGWEAGAVYDGIEAVLKVMDGGWDAVLMDIRMPNLDGLHALTIMLQHNRRLPVVLFTGQAGQGDMMNAFRRGAYACLLKPLEGRKVVVALQEAMDRAAKIRIPKTASLPTPIYQQR